MREVGGSVMVKKVGQKSKSWLTLCLTSGELSLSAQIKVEDTEPGWLIKCPLVIVVIKDDNRVKRAQSKCKK